MMRPFLFACLLLIASAVFLKPDAGLGLHSIESLSLWAIHDDLKQERTPRAFIRNTYQDIRQTWERSSEAPHTPFYYQVLNGWSMLIGDSITGARWLSTALIWIGMAGLARLCLFIKPKISLSAVILFGTFILPYFANLIHPASLIFALSMTGGAVLFMWTESGRRRYLALYGLLSLLQVIISPYAVLGLALHALLLLEKYQFKTQRSHVPLGVFVLAGGVAVAIHLINRSTYPLTDYGRNLELAVLLLPMVIFLCAWAFSGALKLQNPVLKQALPVAIVIVGFVLGIGINTVLFNQHPDWHHLIAQFNAERQPLEGGISVLSAQHPLNFYQDQWRKGVMVDMGWQTLEPESAETIISKLGVGRRWAIVDQQHPNTEILTAILPNAVVKWWDGEVVLWEFVTDF
jgi:hypothetical protein